MMSQFIKTLDPNHMVAFGTEGYMNRTDTANGQYQYSGQTGQDFDAEIRLPAIDFGTVHLYPTQSPGLDLPWTLDFLSKHEESAVDARKPMIMEEYGVPRVDNTATFPAPRRTMPGTRPSWRASRSRAT